jgi:hypothetical protein
LRLFYKITIGLYFESDNIFYMQKEIYFHVGPGKTGTTFLQYRVFPKFRGIQYIQRTKYKHAKSIIEKSSADKILVSREFDRQLEREVKKFASHFPDAKPIIVFRRHDSWIASQYRRFVKNGFREGFSVFFDLHHDRGFFKSRHLEYMGMIETLEKCFSHKPYVLFYEDMRKDFKGFVDNLAQLTGATYNYNAIDQTKKHTSYNEKQLKAMQYIGRFIDMRKRTMASNTSIDRILRFGISIIRYTTLYVSLIIPKSFFSQSPLISDSELEEIKTAYTKDWELCNEYARHNNRESPVKNNQL